MRVSSASRRKSSLPSPERLGYPLLHILPSMESSPAHKKGGKGEFDAPQQCSGRKIVAASEMRIFAATERISHSDMKEKIDVVF